MINFVPPSFDEQLQQLSSALSLVSILVELRKNHEIGSEDWVSAAEDFTLFLLEMKGEMALPCIHLLTRGGVSLTQVVTDPAEFKTVENRFRGLTMAATVRPNVLFSMVYSHLKEKWEDNGLVDDEDEDDDD